MKVETHFIKNNDFRTVQCSGAFGGVTSNGLINMNMYTDRVVIPNTITLEVDEKDGQHLREIGRESKNGIVREVQFGMLIDVNVAKSLVEWINEQIKIIESVTGK